MLGLSKILFHLITIITLEIRYCSYFTYEENKIFLTALVDCLMATYPSFARMHTFCNVAQPRLLFQRHSLFLHSLELEMTL